MRVSARAISEGPPALTTLAVASIGSVETSLCGDALIGAPAVAKKLMNATIR